MVAHVSLETQVSVAIVNKDSLESSLCEVELDFCLSSPCLNGGQCLSHEEGQLDPYACKCPEGFQGKDCEFDEDECLFSPCQNGGTCINEISSYTCLCGDKFQGQNCEQQVNDCIENACQNGGTCLDGVGNYSCKCGKGFRGSFCEIDIDECLNNQCYNGGTCIDGPNEFQCLCPLGYEGELCEIDIDECATFEVNPCLNGGACKDHIGYFVCNCQPGFAGEWCDVKLPTNYVLEFGSADGLIDSVTTEYAMLSTRQIPSMKELTFCFWMSTTDKSNYGTPLSYAVLNQDNEITFTDYSGFVFAIKGNKVVTDVTANKGLWTFLCASWASKEGAWAIYQDSVLVDEGRNLSKGETIEGDGVLILGQEQDSLGTKFSSVESFKGKMTRLNIWNRVLHLAEVHEAMTSCTELAGNIASWPDFHKGIYGRVKVTDLTPCQGCPHLEAPSHGSVSISSPFMQYLTNNYKRKPLSGLDSTNFHLIANYTCEEGYAISGGDSLRACGVLGNWRGQAPTCKLVNCGFPGFLSNGIVTGQSYLFGDVVAYICRQGFQLMDGDRTQWCGRDGKWSGKKPVCREIVCRLDEPFMNGYVMSSKAEYRVGDAIELRCNGSDLSMDGPSRLTCLEDGSWSDVLPTCKGPPCSKIPSVAHGDILAVSDDNFLGLNIDDENYPTNTVVNYFCKEGYTLHPRSNDKVFCLRNGLWSVNRYHQSTKNLPKCIPLNCDIPKNFQHGKVYVQSEVAGYNETARLVCNDGYKIFTPTSYQTQVLSVGSLRCSARSTWVMISPGSRSGIELSAVKCRPMKCPFPTEISKGIVEFSGLSIGSMARYSCQRPFRLVGRAQRRCLSSGHWSHKTPKCVT